MPFLYWLSAVLGWGYTLIWSATFYPQVILSYRRQSVRGVSLDSLALSILGHASYVAYNATLLFSTSIRAEYASRHNGARPPVAMNDLAFSLHATLIYLFRAYQAMVYEREPGQRVSPFTRTVITTFTSVALFGAVAIAFANPAGSGVEYAKAEDLAGPTISWLDFANFLSLIKVYVTLTKYWPQVRVNHLRRSTDGFAIEACILDASGGILSLAQLALDSGLAGDWDGVFANPAKLGLALATLFFDAVLCFQHYALYRDPQGERLGLSLESGRFAYSSCAATSERESALPSSGVADLLTKQVPRPM